MPDVNHNEALLWLHDHCGQQVSASTNVEVGDLGDNVLWAEGKLQHWREHEAPSVGGIREDIIGLYTVGSAEAALDVTALASFSARVDFDGKRLTFVLGDGVWIDICSKTESLGAAHAADGDD
jgi:hypothetical protein